MKIVLCKKSGVGFKLRRYTLPVVLCVLLVSVTVSQIFIGLGVAPEQDVSVPADTLPSDGSIELTVVGEIMPDSAWVWVNGEPVATFVDGKAFVDTGDRCVIEVMNESGAVFDVYISARSANVETVGAQAAVKCQKGLTYICRCYCT